MQTFPEVKGPFMDHFVTFPTDARMYNRPVTSVTGKNVRVSSLLKTIRLKHQPLVTLIMIYFFHIILTNNLVFSSQHYTFIQ